MAGRLAQPVVFLPGGEETVTVVPAFPPAGCGGTEPGATTTPNHQPPASTSLIPDVDLTLPVSLPSLLLWSKHVVTPQVSLTYPVFL